MQLPAAMLPELAIIVPILNERDNLAPLVAALDRALAGRRWEVIFVDDDSRDGTEAELHRLEAEDSRVRHLRRVGRRGLASACIEGWLATAAPLLAVMDGDLQHDESLLPAMADLLQADSDLDVVVASRFAGETDPEGLSDTRTRLSRLGNRLCGLVTRAELTDPLTGFFMIRRPVLDATVHRLSGRGFKILLDLFASSPKPLRFRELPMHFRARQAGESKLDAQVVLQFGLLLADKTIGRYIPLRFLQFVSVGLLGAVVHLAVLALLHRGLDLPFYWGQVGATVIAMTSNFVLNNLFTYRDRALRGWAFLRGLVTFYAFCAIGALANFQLAAFLFGLDVPWLLAGLLGATVGAVWNYGLNTTFTWGRLRPGH